MLAQTAAQAPAAPQAQAPAPPPDIFKFATNSPVLIVNQIKPERVADFEAGWQMIREKFAKSDRPEVKEFAATLEKFYRVDLSGAPVAIYVFQVDSPSTTYSYHPGKIVYDLLYYVKEGKEFGIPRAEADEIYKKLDGAYANLAPWPLKKVGS